MVERCVRATVLVVDGVLEPQRQNGGDGSLILVCHANLEGFAETFDEIPKPEVWLWRYVMTSSCRHEQRVKISQQLLISATFFNQVGPRSPANSALNGIFVKVSKNVR